MNRQTFGLEPAISTSSDRIFFQALAALVTVVIFVGFAQTYFLSGLLKAPPFKARLGPPHPLSSMFMRLSSRRGRSCSWRKHLFLEPAGSTYIAGSGRSGSPWRVS
jgi:hypothetical protein